ncbi:MAG: histidine phosphotransferase [Rhodobacter sp.]|jgi:histidine phosphotransferase ChpT|nr:histidine phosphotransferase [Rhodobacter sp.]
MTHAPKDLAALLGSRICHDLISPIGAISNGVELLQMSGGPMSPEIELISESVANANARIRYFRVAYGAASDGQVIGSAEIRGILADLSHGSRLRINWQVSGDQLRQEVKLAFLMLQCFETAMPWGGQISVSCEDGQWIVSGTSDRMKLDTELWQALAEPNGNADIGAAQVQFLLLPLLLKSTGRSLLLELSETGAVARF